MEAIDRRSALALGLTVAAPLPALFTPATALAQRYRADEGKEIAPGVRRVDLSKRGSEIAAYATVSMRDIVYQPGAKSDNPGMPNDMVCHCLEGELQVNQGPGKQFVAKTGDVWSCMKGMPEANANNGSTVAIMRVIDLLGRT
jgi:quercetin dioxygenase-like cupin family protein